jgi:hypothetical protein
MSTMTTYERAIQIYQVLIAAAHARQTLTYELLGEKIGVPQQGLGRHLEHLLRYCQHNQLPPLTVLVVQKGSGKPGVGLTTSTDINADRERVFQHLWFRMKPLTVEELKQPAEMA